MGCIKIGGGYFKGYGGVETLSETAMSDITSTPQTLPTLVESTNNPKLVTQDVGNDGLIFNKIGVWQLSIGFQLTVGASGQKRKMRMQIYNQTDAIDILTGDVIVGTNQQTVDSSRTFLFNVTEDRVGKLIVLRVYSNTNTFTTVSLVGLSHIGILVD